MSGKKFKFNIIDAVIILVLIAAIAVLAYVFVISDDSEVDGEAVRVEYVIEVTSVNEIFRDAVSEGDRVTFDSDRTLEIGTVSAPPEVRTSVKTMYDNETGEEVYCEAEGLIDMIITFEADAVKTEWGYCIDEDAYITVNNSNVFLIGGFNCAGVCTKLTVIEE